MTPVIASATKVFDINKKGITNIPELNKYVSPVDSPQRNATFEFSPVRTDRYSDAVIESAAATDAIIAVNRTTYCPAAAKTSPTTRPVVDTIASCMPNTAQPQKEKLFCCIQKNYPQTGVNITGFVSWTLPCRRMVAFFNNGLFFFPY